MDGLTARDRGVLQALTSAGADLSEPRHALFFLYFGDEPFAAAAGEEARQHGFEVSVSGPAHPEDDQWCLVCERRDLVTDPRSLPGLDALFSGIAERFEGRYDGWEASV